MWLKLAYLLLTFHKHYVHMKVNFENSRYTVTRELKYTHWFWGLINNSLELFMGGSDEMYASNPMDITVQKKKRRGKKLIH